MVQTTSQQHTGKAILVHMRDHDAVRMTPLTEILHAKSSVDFGGAPADPNLNVAWWQKIINTKSSDLGFGTLLNAIMERGFDPNSPVGWDPDNMEITEGHHRIVAALLLGLDAIPSSIWGGGNGDVCAHNCGCNGESERDRIRLAEFA